MNRNLLIAIIAVVAIGAGYYQFSYLPAQQAAEQKAAEEKAAQEAEAAAAKAAEEAAAAAKKAEEEAAAAAAKAAEEAAALAAEVLDPAKFDAAKLKELIGASALNDAVKTQLNAAVDAAAANPAGVPVVVETVKKALGM